MGHMSEKLPPISDLRRAYGEAGLGDLPLNPMTKFRTWMQDAAGNPYVVEPNAMVLSTTDEQGQVWSRSVLLKGIDEAGRIIKSSPSGGVQVAKGSEVKIIVSKGPERFTVPSIIGLSLTEATSLLSDNNLQISTLATQYDDKVPLGYIISSSPSTGSKLKRNSVVGVIVSKGIEEVAIESFVGKLSDQALSQLKESGFTVVIQSDYSNSISAGRVISQVPSTGKLAKGSKVALVVSKGPNLITVPNVVKNLTGAQAGKILEDLGLTFKPNILKRNGPGKVIGQSIKAGTKVKPGSLVILDIY